MIFKIFFKGFALHAGREDVAAFLGDWIPWLARETLCNMTIDSVEDFYDCIETLLYSRDQLILESVFFSFSTTLVTPATNVKWENYIEAGIVMGSLN